jgi:hypothetical protein
MARIEESITSKENALDWHIHLHIHEIMPGRWLLPRSTKGARICLKVFCGLVLTMSIIGVLWSQW